MIDPIASKFVSSFAWVGFCNHPSADRLDIYIIYCIILLQFNLNSRDEVVFF